ncbi:type VI immunity family protein, partial [Pyxidicoccus sp. 3LFB2]
MIERYPRIRIQAEGGGVFIRDGLTIRFFMHRSHQEFAPSVVAALDTFIQAVRPQTLAWSPDMEGDWRRLDDRGWQRIWKELLEAQSPYITLANRPDGAPDFQFEYSGVTHDETGPFDEPGRSCDAWFWLSTEFLEQHGPGHVRDLAMKLGATLPFHSGYTSLSINALHGLLGVTRRVRQICFRYPGMDVLNDSIYRDIGTRVPGAYWLTFLGPPVLGELGGVEGLRARLSSPGTTVQPLEGERAVVTLGEWPEAGDLE